MRSIHKDMFDFFVMINPGLAVVALNQIARWDI